ncbi:hypothetical protein A0H81_00559 [Grifola frondosa]|uniref:Nucleolar 27S pre-rRNA processing Urb2/Npa2 C-terminal domain-containing protein n=1 Tax=Grifola frondosa TaxID=5627 RepID=A0A1C7MQ71_GRIFR|nr:hypothetical protein A0H81_00559 [Grifola frondosa]
MPRLFKSYVESIKRYKGALFSQGSNQAPGHISEQVQVTGMAYYALSNSLLDLNASDERSWRARVKLLEIVETENLFSAKDDEARRLLRQNGDLATEVLVTAWKEQQQALTNYAVEELSILTRIDYDVMSPALPVIFPRLASIHECSPPVLTYLRLLLEYHSKTRTLQSLVLHLIEAFSVRHLQRISEESRVIYQIVSAGPLLNLTYLDQLSRAIYNFLTPGQVVETANSMLQALKDALNEFAELEAAASADRGEGSRKKRKKTSTALSTGHIDPEWASVTFALVARAVIVVITSLPVHSLLEDVRLDLQHSIERVYTSIVSRILEETLQPGDRRGIWHWQMMATSALRIHYGLARAPQLRVQLNFDHKLHSAMLSCIMSDETTPELCLEMFRTLLDQCTQGLCEPQGIFDKLLGYLEKHSISDDAVWSGKVHDLTIDSGYNQGAVAVFHLLVDRWLPLFDASSSKDQLTQLAKFVIVASRTSVSHHSQHGSTTSAILTRMLHDAEFWELSNFRDVFLSHLYKQTAALESVDLPQLLSALSAGPSPQSPIKDLSQVIATYNVLLLAPSEYLPRAFHLDFLRRALAADVAVSLALQRNKGSHTVNDRSMLIIREFIRRTLLYLGPVEQVMKEYLDYLLNHLPSSLPDSHFSSNILSVTMDIINLYLSSFIKSAKKGEEDAIINVVTSCMKSIALNRPLGQRSASEVLHQRSCLYLIDTLIANYVPTNFSQRLASTLQQLHARLVSFCLPHMVTVTSGDIPAQGLQHYSDLLNTWSRVLSLGRWLHLESSDGQEFGRSLVGSLILFAPEQRKNAADICTPILAILAEELQKCLSTSREVYLEYVITAYLAFAYLCGPEGLKTLDAQVSSTCRTLAVADFTHALDIIFEALPISAGLPLRDVASLIRLTGLMLHDAPDGTSKVTQNHMTRCLNLFADHTEYITFPVLRQGLLTLITRQCNEHPASIRIADLSSIWSILANLISGSVEHDKVTDTSTFHGIITIISALSSSTVGGQAEPTGHGLTPATIVRVHGSSAEMQKPESLARPFSKHAAYVLTAYIDAVNDPLCFVSTQVRKELQPGLFILCDMLGEHNRDAMMVSALDAGGKTTMKALWKEYEKQRYIGKG